MKKQLFNFISKYKGTSIGFLFLVISFILSQPLLFIPKLLSIFFGVAIEGLTSFFVEPNPYQKLAIVVILIHLVLFIAANILLIRFIKFKQVSKMRLFLIFGIFYLLNHSLINYVYWWYDCNFCGYKDGQLFFSFFDVIPTTISSLIFLFQGIMIDCCLILFKKFHLFEGKSKEDLQKIVLEKQNLFEAKVNSLIEIHKNSSLKELEKIAANKNWTLEAREAAKRIINIKKENTLNKT